MFLRNFLLNFGYNHLINYPTPSNLTYAWNFGALSGLVLALQIITGIFLVMYYTPSIGSAFASIDYIMREVNEGWLIRYLHCNGASFFFFVVYLHMARSLFYNFFTRNRIFLWFSGVVIFILLMAIAFLGYILPWGQMSFWGATVITNLVTAIPTVGSFIALWLWGGFSVANATLMRFFSLHYFLPFVLLGLVIVHFAFLHLRGSLNPLGVLGVDDKIPFYPYFYLKDYFSFVILLVFLLFIITYYPDVLGHSDNYIEANALVTPSHIVPEWYFLPFYAILRCIPNKLGGVVAMAGSLLILFFVPFIVLRYFSMFGRLWYIRVLWFFFFTVLLLGYLGGQPVEEPYIFFSQLYTVGYFLFFGGITFLFSISYRFFRVHQNH